MAPLQVSPVDAALTGVAGHLTRAAGVVNAEDLKLIEKNEATRCLRAFLQVVYHIYRLQPCCALQVSPVDAALTGVAGHVTRAAARTPLHFLHVFSLHFAAGRK